ncbi:MAG: hypothetical protein KIT16_18180 [Rhodospirillaceae bacterium]|nr:hypothetical protein [Rhodospirillaceae bacterium]
MTAAIEMAPGAGRRSREILLVGSMPCADADQAMAAAWAHLGPGLARVPDGETGPRAKFIGWQAALLAQSGLFDHVPLGPSSQWAPNGELPPRILKLKPGAAGAPVFPPTGYAAAAIESYAVLERLKREGRVGESVRLQVCLPTPLGVLAAYMEPAGQRVAEPAYRARFEEDIAALAAAIPHDRLAIQWDVPQELAVWEGACDTYLDPPRDGVLRKLADLVDRIPPQVEAGVHLCYGDIGHKHWKEPDLALMVDFANALAVATRRRIDFVHMPVPRRWRTAEDFAALGRLRLAPETRLFLGLVHATDGIEGARLRLDAARAHRAEFGVAASCGLGRRKPEDIGRILDLHRAVAALD